MLDPISERTQLDRRVRGNELLQGHQRRSVVHTRYLMHGGGIAAARRATRGMMLPILDVMVGFLRILMAAYTGSPLAILASSSSALEVGSVDSALPLAGPWIEP
ncbi:MAG: hypothetical protein WAN65_10260 [Candidatus Sulfotelmatobacter sp.]